MTRAFRGRWASRRYDAATMAGNDRMEPLERLLNLVALLLETRTPLTFEQIRETLEPYRQEKVDSAKRMFERDKDLLRDFGVPLELVDVDAWGGEQGYLIPKDAYYLPEIAFTPEELGALLVAAQSGDENTAAERAVHKLLYGADGGVLAGLAGGPLASGSDARSGLVLAVAAAAQQRHRIALRVPHLAGQGVRARGRRLRDGVPGRALVPGGARPRPGRRPRLPAVAVHHRPGGPGRGLRAARRVQGGRPRAGGPVGRAGRGAGRDRVLPGGRLVGGGIAAGRHRPTGTRDDGWVEVAVPLADEQALAGLDPAVRGPRPWRSSRPSLRDAIVDRLDAIRA